MCRAMRPARQSADKVEDQTDGNTRCQGSHTCELEAIKKNGLQCLDKIRNM